MNRLLEAVLDQDVNLVFESIAAGLDLEDQDADGRTPLINAAAQSNVELVSMLLDAGASIDAQDSAGFTALHFAAMHHDLPIMTLLTKAGAEVDLPDEHGNTPLSTSVYYRTDNRNAAIRLLLQCGANPNAQNIHGVSPRSLSESSPDLPVEWDCLM